MATNRTACGILCFYSAGSRSPFVRSRGVGAVICLCGFTLGLCVSLWRSRRGNRGRGERRTGLRGRRRGFCASLRNRIGFAAFSAGSTLGLRAPKPAPKSRMWKRHCRLSGLSSRCGGVGVVRIRRACASLRNHIGIVMLSAGSTLGLRAPNLRQRVECGSGTAASLDSLYAAAGLPWCVFAGLPSRVVGIAFLAGRFASVHACCLPHGDKQDGLRYLAFLFRRVEIAIRAFSRCRCGYLPLLVHFGFGRFFMAISTG